MHGLPLQSVYQTNTIAYHQIQRLLTVVYAPLELIDSIISKQEILQKLFRNEWVHLNSFNPSDGHFYALTPELKWKRLTTN